MRGPTSRRVAAVLLSGLIVAAGVTAGVTAFALQPARPATHAKSTAPYWSVLSKIAAAAAGSGESLSVAGGPITLSALACAAADCVAVGGPWIAAGDLAGTYVLRRAPAGTGYLSGVACPSATRCIAIAQQDGLGKDNLVVTSRDGGRTWTGRQLPTAVDGLASISCPSVSDCMAVGEGGGKGEIVTTADGGATWRLVHPELAGLDAVACTSGRRCVAAGWLTGGTRPALIRTTDGGRTWLAGAVPAGVQALDTISCPASLVCYGGGFAGARGQKAFPGAIVVTGDGGASWALLGPPAQTGPVNAISCLDAARCVAVGTASAGARGGPAGSAVSTADGGRHWSVDELPPSVEGIAGATCVPPTECLAIAAGTLGHVALVIETALSPA
jgi:hypothetical protein